MLDPFRDWLAEAPLWLITLVVFGGMFAASVVGDVLRTVHDRRVAVDGTAGDSESNERSTMASAVLALLALLIAFTFSIAIDRFDTRRVNVLNEANAIGTTYLRAQLLEEPHRARISRLLVRYTQARLDLATASPGPAQREFLATSDRLIVDLWSATVAAYPSIRQVPLSHSFLETMNNLIDMDSTRKAGRQANVPAAVFLVLFLYLFIAAAVINFVVVGRKGRRTSLIMFFLFGVLLMLIIDVVRPTAGGIVERQEPMLQLRDFMRAQPPESFERFVPAPAPAPVPPRQGA